MQTFSTFPFDPALWRRHALVSSETMRMAEQGGCASGLVTLWGLMAQAGEAVAEAVRRRWQSCRVLVLCGPGNNGGDGFVAAESLRRSGWPVTVMALEMSGSASHEARQARGAWQGSIQPWGMPALDSFDLVLDAVFGTGFRGPLPEIVAAVTEAVAARRLPVIAIDIPSGVDADTGRVAGAAFQANLTLALFRKKPGHVLYPGAAQCGETQRLSIGLPDSVLDELAPAAAVNVVDLWRALLPLPRADSHKYTRGHALVYGGPVMTGAARLAARAAQRVGAGLVTLAAPERAVMVYAAALESVIVRQAETTQDWHALLSDPQRRAILIGPGMGLTAESRGLVLAALETGKPCVLDADALTIFAGSAPDLVKALHSACILTPHEGEFARLFSDHVDADADKVTRTRQAAALAGCPVLLKGADTVIANPEGLAIVNNNAPPWLATAGAGDVLSGMILGLLAPGMPSMAAAAAAANLHGGIARQFGPGLIAEDIVAGIPAALRDMPTF